MNDFLHHFPANLCKSQFPGVQVKIFKLLVWLKQEYKELNKPSKQTENNKQCRNNVEVMTTCSVSVFGSIFFFKFYLVM